MADKTKREVMAALRRVERRGSGGPRSDTDRVVVEGPLEIRVAGDPFAVVMRTPGHDQELVRGLLLGEGIISCGADVVDISRPPEGELSPEEKGNVVDVSLADGIELGRENHRNLIASSSCGVCGKLSIAALELRAEAVRSQCTVTEEVLSGLPEKMREAQEIFEMTGGLHGAAAFSTDGDLLAVREDVGRHNAVDKLVGWAISEARIPLSDCILSVSGRLSFEIVQKAIAAGFPVIAAVSAPSSLAVDLAERFRVTLCGFVRDGRFNVYSHSTRIVDR